MTERRGIPVSGDPGDMQPVAPNLFVADTIRTKDGLMVEQTVTLAS